MGEKTKQIGYTSGRYGSTFPIQLVPFDLQPLYRSVWASNDSLYPKCAQQQQQATLPWKKWRRKVDEKVVSSRLSGVGNDEISPYKGCQT